MWIRESYKDLEIKITWNLVLNTKTIPVTVDAMGMRKIMQIDTGLTNAYNIGKIALLSTARILHRIISIHNKFPYIKGSWQCSESAQWN